MNKQLAYGCCVPRSWGLYVKQTQAAVPLKSLDISINIIHNTARVFYTQVYYNDANSLLESEFFFPISPDACFDSFEAKFDNTTIKGVIKKKEEAKEEYKEAISQGRTAAYSEINQETGDIMKVMVGNIPPKTEISIIYSYIQKLETSLSKFWCFRLFSTITPRYNGNINEILQADINLLASYPTISKNNSQAYPWTIKAEIQSPSPITLLESPTHKIVPTYGNENHTCSITFDPSSISHPNKDFVLLYSNGKEGEKVDYVLTPFEEGYCAMVTLLADFEKESVKGAYEKYVKPQAKEAGNQYSMKSIKGEYIFLLDRSGSMGGERITMALSSLQLFLKSLPQDSYFNVVSFGSSFNLMYPESVQYSQQTLSSTNDQLKSFSANMGGTEIYNALQTLFKAPLKKGYPRSVFLLTDGGVSNTYQVLELIKDNSEKSRVFTIGVGNGCSPELITKGAYHGKGKHEFVSDSKEIYEKVIALLNASLSPSYSDLALEATNFDAVVKSVSPNPSSLPFLLAGQNVTFFMLLRDAAFDNDSQKMTVKLKLYDTTIQDYRTIEAVLDKNDAMNHELIPKLAIHDMMKRLEEAQKDNSQKETDVVLWLNDKEEIKAALLELSLKYGILCKETAFFCDIKENDDIVKSFKQEKVVVPTIASNDYDGTSIGGLASSSKMAFFAKKGMSMKRSAMPQASATLSRGSGAGSMKELESASRQKSGPGIFSKLASGAANTLGSLFTAKKETPVSKPLSTNTYQKNLSMGAPEKKSKARPPSSALQRNSVATNEKEEAFSDSMPSMTSGHSYLDAVMKQSFEGSWDSNDTQLLKIILKGGKLPEVPSQVNSAVAWMTILVLLWLEIACKKDKNAWALIHQKGSEWLKTVGVEYEDVKKLGESYIKA